MQAAADNGADSQGEARSATWPLCRPTHPRPDLTSPFRFPDSTKCGNRDGDV